jgi:ribonuclease E
MVVNDAQDECRIAILEQGHLEELYSERVTNATNVGNIYKGRVTNVEPAIQAAFIDYGRGTNGFLHISDLHPRYFPGGENVERVGRKIPRRARPPIQEALRRGDEVLVQVIKEGVGTKGPTLTSYLSIPGRLLVCMPYMDRVGVSRKVEDEDRRREMRKILDTLDLPEGFGFILRTAGFDRTKTELKRDVAYLLRLWKVMEKRINNVGAPCELYTESDLLIRTIRDVLRPEIKSVVVDSESAFNRVDTFLKVVAPRSAPQVLRYARNTPIFHAFDIERQIEMIHSREVPLPSGGALVIDQTEALVAIDVNSGKSRRARDSETNAFNTNCEAVDEICRQIRLRDLGGLIINDLIDMAHHRHRRSIEDRLNENLKRDRARTTWLKISDFGLIEMTRQRMRPSLRKAHFVDCPHCEGRGEIKSPDSVAADVTRQVGFLLDNDRVRRVEIVCSPRVASVLLSRKRRELVQLEDAQNRIIEVRVSDDIAVDRVDYYAYDERNADVDVRSLPAAKMPTIKELLREQTQAEEEDATDAPEIPSRRRRSRRRRSGPADASAIALAGGFDDDFSDDEMGAKPAEAPSRRSRRRRRKKKTGDQDAAVEISAVADSAPEEQSPEQRIADENAAAAAAAPIRIHLLAKEIGIESKEILDRCKEHGGIEVTTHMSSVSGEHAALIRTWFASEPAAPAEPETPSDGESDGETPAKKRRRRRRGGRRRSGKPRSDTEAKEPVDEKPAEQAPAPDETTAPKKKKKTSRRTKRSKTDRTDSGHKSDPASKDDQSADAAEPPAKTKKKRTRKKKTDKKPAESAPKSESKQADNAPEADATPDEKPKKQRRVLYRGRRTTGRPAVASVRDDD